MNRVRFSSLVFESAIHTVHQQSGRLTAGMISGYHHASTEEENRRRRTDMMIYLHQKGYSITLIAGEFLERGEKRLLGGPKREFLFVIGEREAGGEAGELEADLVRLARLNKLRYILSIRDRTAFIVKTTPYELARKVKVEVGSEAPGRKRGFLELFFGKKFVFSSVEEILSPGSSLGNLGWHLHAQSIQKQLDESG